MNNKKMRKRKQRAPLLLPHASGVLTGVEKISAFHCNVNKKNSCNFAYFCCLSFLYSSIDNSAEIQFPGGEIT